MMYGKCKGKSTPDIWGQKSEAGYPMTAQKGAPGVDKSVMAKGMSKGGEAEVVADKSGKMMDSTFAAISDDVSYSKTPNKG